MTSKLYPLQIIQHQEPSPEKIEECGGRGVLEAVMGTELVHPSIVQVWVLRIQGSLVWFCCQSYM